MTVIQSAAISNILHKIDILDLVKIVYNEKL